MDAVKRALDGDSIEPTWHKHVPFCARDGCPRYDGKRCDAMGFQPQGICEPAVKAMGASLAGQAKRRAKAPAYEPRTEGQP